MPSDSTLRTIHRTLVAALLVLGVSVASACVFDQHRAYRAAQRAYEECLAAHEGELEDCRSERDLANQRYTDYERDAKRAWGCENANDCAVGPDRGFE